jgi:hypothetical protein
MPSLFVQVIVVPAGTVIDVGLKAELSIQTSFAPGPDGPPSPYEFELFEQPCEKLRITNRKLIPASNLILEPINL